MTTDAGGIEATVKGALARFSSVQVAYHVRTIMMYKEGAA